MIGLLRKRVGPGHAVDFVVAALSAVALWAFGLSEVSWAPLFLVAVSATTRGGCLARPRGANRS